jgi:hypothetical protein
MKRTRFIKWIEYNLIHRNNAFPTRIIEVGKKAMENNPKLERTLYEDLAELKSKYASISSPEDERALTLLQNVVRNAKARKTFALRRLRTTTS